MSEKNTKKAAPVRDLSVKQGFKISRFLVSWEMVLVYISGHNTVDHSVRYGCMPTGTWDDLYPDVRRH